MQAQDSRAVQKKQSLDVISVKRNPYLVDYEEQRRLKRAVNEPFRRSGDVRNGRSRKAVEAGGRNCCRPVEATGRRRRREAAPEGRNRRRSVEVIGERSRKPAEAKRGHHRRSVDLIDIKSTQPRYIPAGRGRNPAAAKKAAQRRRKKQIRHRRMMIAAWVLCMFMVGWLIQVKKGEASSAEKSGYVQELSTAAEESQEGSSAAVQGLPAKVYEKHPAWTEDFLPLNEYSRPGEPLPEVNDIFVHYTANPGTSAAQNRSYFAQQKDMHEASVSAHFIIGYNGEIIQCVPLNEIAYAVQTRNYDSVSIECCYKAADGSFTQETYDSLISLLAWLTDAYDLDVEHILRHYDCGGKKCPVYYTENVDAWIRLKKDVAEKRGSIWSLL